MKDKETGIVNIGFYPPLILKNLSVFPLTYNIPLCYQRPPGVIEASSTKSFYIDTDTYANVFINLEGYDKVDRAIPIEQIRKTSIEVKKNEMSVLDGEKNGVILNVFNNASLPGSNARIMYINTQFLIVNATDLMLFVKQRGTKNSVISLVPRSHNPYSWYKSGARQLMIKVGDTEWSKAINIWKPTIVRLSIQMPEMNISYDFALEVTQSDDYSRIVVIRPWLRIINYTSHPLSFRIGSDIENDYEDDVSDEEIGLTEVSFSSGIIANLNVEPESSLELALSPPYIFMSITDEHEGWPYLPCPINEVGQFTIKVVNTINPHKFYAIDVEVKFSPTGYHISYRENKDPPYVFVNNTMFPISLKQNAFIEFGGLEELIVGPRNRIQYWYEQRSMRNDIFNIEDGESFVMSIHTDDTDIIDLEFSSEEITEQLEAVDELVNLNQNLTDSQILSQNEFYKGMFSPDRNFWSEPFSIDVVGDHVIKFVDTTNLDNNDYNKISMKVTRQGKTKVLIFSLPEIDEKEETYDFHTLDVFIRIPTLEIALIDDNQKELLYATISTIDADYSQFSSSKNYLYFIIEDFEIDTMFERAEYPVLLATDRKKLYEFEANFTEILLEWISRDDRTYIDYLGLRVLPFILKFDGLALAAVKDFTKGLFNVEDEQDTAEEFLANYIQPEYIDDIIPESEEQNVYLDRLDIFPMEMNISVGTNTLYWPLMTAASLNLKWFKRRRQVHENLYSLFNYIHESYVSAAWTELYKISLELDFLASPLQNGRKIVKGSRDFILMPIESLVFDDSPGVFLIGLYKGTKSLLLNFSDFSFTLFMKVTQSLSWVVHFITFDAKYRLLKENIYKNHPKNFIYGLYQGMKELLRGIWCGLSGLILQPIEHVQESGPLGIFTGLGVGILGIPLKPVGGVFDFLAKSLEGALNSLGRGYHMQTRIHPFQNSDLTQTEFGNTVTHWINQHRDQSILQGRAREVLPDGRIKPKYLVLARLAFYIFKIRDDNSKYIHIPRAIPINNIVQVVAPVVPETNFTIILDVDLYRVDTYEYEFIVPNREELLSCLSELGVDVHINNNIYR
eukprot:TRINITY_DN9008_c0_g1_i1.p1 TRINITY_DN9008_c0_g1~~TRINITY_DN9008_c0_g1_i1.p1  ORF type:complete len:1235 (-),score=269.52 TRINITY_DN9008_c0_g1_i1:19-3240(-)